MRAELRRVWDDYVRHSGVHGVVYVGGINTSAKERLIWAAAMVLLVAAGYTTCKETVFGNMAYSTTTVITDPHLPVSLFSFPALSLCPLNKVRRTIGEKLLLEHLGVPEAQCNSTLRSQLTAVMRTLSFVEMTQMTNIKPSLLGVGPLASRLEGLNVTDFMLRVLPTCRQLFSRCTWHGAVEDCCDLLHVQPSDFGYCYAFNSLSTLRSRHCEIFDSHANAMSTSTSPISVSTSPECELRRTNSYGMGSALQVYLGELNDSDIIEYRRQRGLVVCVHQNIDLPLPTAGFLLPARGGKQLELSIGIENTVADKEVLQLPIELRRCLSREESYSKVTRSYSAETCILLCKLQYIYDTCRCVPYMFARPRLRSCSMSQMMCLTGLDLLKTVLPPFSFPNDAVGRRGINCSHCIRSCEVVSYQLDTKSRADRSDRFVTRAGSVSVYIDIGEGAKMYTTKLDHGLVNRIAIVGSVAGLAMGMSIVSVVEAVYYLLKAVLVLAGAGPSLLLQGRVRRLCRLELVRRAVRAVRRAQRLARRWRWRLWPRWLQLPPPPPPPPPPSPPPVTTLHI